MKYKYQHTLKHHPRYYNLTQKYFVILKSEEIEVLLPFLCCLEAQRILETVRVGRLGIQKMYHCDFLSWKLPFVVKCLNKIESLHIEKIDNSAQQYLIGKLYQMFFYKIVSFHTWLNSIFVSNGFFKLNNSNVIGKRPEKVNLLTSCIS